MALLPYVWMIAAFMLALMAPTLPARAAPTLPPAGYAFTPAPGCEDGVTIPAIYDACADQMAVLTAALQKAAGADRRLLVVFGATWCPACRQLKVMLQRGVPELAGREPVSPRLHMVEIAVSMLHRGRVTAVPSGNAALQVVLAERRDVKLRAVPFIAVIDPVSGRVSARNLDDLEDPRTSTLDPQKFAAILAAAEQEAATGVKAPAEPGWFARKWRRWTN